MDLFKLGFRNIVGITIPGALLVLIFTYAIWTGTSSSQDGQSFANWVRDTQALIIVVLFLVSYLLGNLMRLNSADRVDKKSAKRLRKKYILDECVASQQDTYTELRERLSSVLYWDDLANASAKALVRTKCRLRLALAKSGNRIGPFQERLERAWCELKNDPRAINIPESLVDIWVADQFPYPVWEFWKFRLYHPKEVYEFFWQYHDCMRMKNDPAKSGKEFFNYCKMAIYTASKQVSDALLFEIQSAEALVRFYAGTFYALVIGLWALLFLLIWQVTGAQNQVNGTHPALSPLKSIAIYRTLAIAVAIYVMKRMILARFRGLRLKEVDTVYDAFYLVSTQAADRRRMLDKPSES